MSSNPINIDFQIKGIELLNTCLNEPLRILSDSTSFQFDINLEHKVNLENKLVIVVTTVIVNLENKEQLLGQVTTSCIYEIAQMDELYNKETKELKLPDDFVVTLNSISLSTTRGLMFSFFRGTYLHNAVLPIIDPKSLGVGKKKVKMAT
jgi:hypothetical protein